jgi:alkylation response protein AidB-like acyl-CoA dehydrogenase
MARYQAPLRDMNFIYREFLAEEHLEQLSGMDEVSPELVETLLDELGKLAEQVLFPLNRPGDEEACRFENGEVRTPRGFPEAYRRFCEGGWPGLTALPEYGGQGLPHTVYVFTAEMLSAANLSFAIYTKLTHGAYQLLQRTASEEIKSLYLPSLVEGRWTGTMCLTEPQCGTDLGLIRTKAVPQADGSYRLDGSKIFISAGEHDLSENIIQLVLARLPGAPPGVKGISLFLVPKFLVNPDGTLGERNPIVCTAIEHKMGIKASSTCSLSLDGATGYLVGEPHKGLRAMFVMMNSARLDVGLQGLGLAEVACQNAAAYARERLQGRALTGPKHPDKPADPLIVHPDVRRMLLTLRAYTEGMRALAAWVGAQLDRETRHPDPGIRRQAEDFVALMTPVVKAFFTDLGFEATNLAMQVYGGHGYIREHGIEQFVRDARIAQIYEGANGIQALDLVGRKLSAHNGRLLRSFFHPVQRYLDERGGSETPLSDVVQPLAKAFGRLQRATAWIAERGLADPDEAAAAAYDYLHLFGYTALGYVWARMAEIAETRRDADPTGFYRAKRDTARFYMERILPRTSGLYAAILAGGGSIMGFRDEAF